MALVTIQDMLFDIDINALDSKYVRRVGKVRGIHNTDRDFLHF